MEDITVAPLGATPLDNAFFEEDLEFGRDFTEEEWYRTTSGRAAKILLQAHDENETVSVLEFETGESEVRRMQSYRPCLFGPVSSDAEDFDSEVETDTEDAADDVDDIVNELPLLTMPDTRRNRGASWLKMNSLGQLFDKRGAEIEPKKRMTMDAFGNFVLADHAEKRRDPYLEHLKMVREQKRAPHTMEVRATEASPEPVQRKPSRMKKVRNRLTSLLRRSN